MKYSMVKQFSNAALDNIFKFVFKIVDFSKILYEALWAFFDIWVAFYLIFYNFLMYIYYLLLFAIDRGAEESRYTFLFWKRIPRSISRTPEVKISSEHNPIPAMYRSTVKKTTEAVSSVADTVSRSAAAAADLPDIRFSSKPKVKKSFLKTAAEAVANFFTWLKKVFIKPFEVIADFFTGSIKPVREEEEGEKSKSLIDEYIREYERKKK